MIAAVLFCKPEGTEPDAEFTSEVAEICMRKGLLVVHTGRESIKIGPPLTISEDALMEGVEVLDEAIAETIGV
jgi:4-aminobutyrate aminotransferase-like enzyme